MTGLIVSVTERDPFPVSSEWQKIFTKPKGFYHQGEKIVLDDVRTRNELWDTVDTLVPELLDRGYVYEIGTENENYCLPGNRDWVFTT